MRRNEIQRDIDRFLKYKTILNMFLKNGYDDVPCKEFTRKEYEAMRKRCPYTCIPTLDYLVKNGYVKKVREEIGYKKLDTPYKQQKVVRLADNKVIENVSIQAFKGKGIYWAHIIQNYGMCEIVTVSIPTIQYKRYYYTVDLNAIERKMQNCYGILSTDKRILESELNKLEKKPQLITIEYNDKLSRVNEQIHDHEYFIDRLATLGLY